MIRNQRISNTKVKSRAYQALVRTTVQRDIHVVHVPWPITVEVVFVKHFEIEYLLYFYRYMYMYNQTYFFAFKLICPASLNAEKKIQKYLLKHVVKKVIQCLLWKWLSLSQWLVMLHVSLSVLWAWVQLPYLRSTHHRIKKLKWYWRKQLTIQWAITYMYVITVVLSPPHYDLHSRLAITSMYCNSSIVTPTFQVGHH